jgi:hypothetical protein
MLYGELDIPSPLKAPEKLHVQNSAEALGRVFSIFEWPVGLNGLLAFFFVSS